MIELAGLTKRYGEKVAVNNLTFTVRPGIVTGFLGPNGAGKSTTMRMMLGLDRPTAGDVRIDGKHYDQLKDPLTYIGALLDAKAMHGGRSAFNHLLCLAQSNGIPKKRVHEVLDTVGLTAVARKKAKGFSLGMGQRLGIATALLGDPEVLILDEPANGLDPAGIRWMRDLLTGFANKGGTVLLSSHLLHEIEVIADDLVVIGQGRIVAQGTKADLLESAGTLVRTSNVVELARALELDGIHTVPTGSDGLRVEAEADQIGKVALAAGVPLTELRAADGAGLEEMFLELTADTSREGAAA
jgi:ABC-2 type transport system ATP-binding protein